MDMKTVPGWILLTFFLVSSEAELLKKVLRHRRQTVLSSREHNFTLPSTNRSMVFNHVYTIHVPANALCTADPDAPDSQRLFKDDSLTTEHTVSEDNQVVFSHRIHIPRKACGCAEDHSVLKELLKRLESLEGQVSALKQKCSGGSAGCDAPVAGVGRSRLDCNGHGTVSADGKSCKCEPGWKGSNCTQSECPQNCQERGRCVRGSCVCNDGFSGEDCSVETCPVDCGTYGQCVGGQCVCSDGFFGENCSQTKCLNNCFGRGLCVDGDCVCDPSWSGLDCSEVACPGDCFSNGRCRNGTCFCEEGYTGKDCRERACVNNCRGNGFCVRGRCVCTAGYSGEDCSVLTCLNECSGRGTCFNGVCICDVGYQGEDCSQLACVNNCNSRGQCINGRCSCDVGFHGEDCSELSCPSSCHHRGRCVNGQCVCQEGYRGEDCSIKSCPSNCFNRGSCIKGQCRCYAGFSGEDCSQMSCPQNCRHRGRCIDGQCVCEEGFTGDDCSQKACPNDCMKRGYCLEGTCICQEGYVGEDCSRPACPDNCSNRGRCVKGKCSCKKGYDGENCASRSCINNCHNNGQCVDGACLCEEGYTGDDCSGVSAPKDLTVGGVSQRSVDLSWVNDMLVSEYLVTSSGSGGQQLELRVPGDQSSATVGELEPGREYLIQVFAVMDNRKSEPVSTKLVTLLPQPESLTFTTIRDTSVEVMWGKLDIPFDGWEIYLRNTKEENGQIVKTVPPSQTQFVQAGLGPGQEYEVSVNIIKNNTRGPKTSRRVTTKTQGPRQLQVKDVSESSALVSWSQAEALTDTIVMSYAPAAQPSDQTRVQIFPPDQQSNIEALRPDTEYVVSLVSRRGESSSEPVTATFTTALDAPKGLQTVSQSDSTITVQWLNSEADVERYRVKYSPISGATHGEELFPRESGDTTTATITGLLPGTEYGIGVTAVKKERESLPTTTNADTDLDPPTNLKRRSSTETSVTLAWHRPRAKVSGYRVDFVSEEGQFGELHLGAADTQCTIPDLSPGTTYTFTLTAERGPKKSTAATLTGSTAHRATSSDVHSLTIKDAPISAPPTFDQDPGTVQTRQRDLLDSDRPSTDSSVMGSGAEPDNSILEDPDLNHTDLWVHNTLPGKGTKNRLTEQKGSPFERVVQEEKSVQLSQPPLKEKQNSVMLNLTIFDITWDSLIATWGPNDVDFESFVIEVTNLDNFVQSQNLTLSGDAFTIVLPGLTPNTSYSVGLYGMYQGSFLEPIYTEATTEAEPEVEHLFVSDVTSDSFRLSWATDEDLFDRFLIKIRDSKRTALPQEYSVHGDERTMTVKGLMGGTEYEIELYGIKLGWRSQGITGIAQTGLSTPQGLHFTEVTDSSAVVHWTQPQSPVDNYRITYVPFEGGRPLMVTVDGKVLEALLPNMNPGKTYQVTVNAVKGLEESDSSTDTVTTGLDRPGRLSALNITDVSALLRWSPSQATVEGYVVTYRADTAPPVVEHVPENTLELEVGSLAPGTHYTVALHAVKNTQKSESAITEFTTDVDPPRDLTATNVQTESATLRWRPPHAAVTGYTLSFSTATGATREVMLSPTATSYNMDDLTGSSEYTVELLALAGTQKSRAISTVFSTVGQLQVFPKDCAEVLLNGESASGLYTIYVGGEENQPLQVYCDMSTDSGGWIVFLRRQNGNLEFFRNWKNYTAGFGNMNHEFWLGLSNLHKITSSGHYELRVDLGDSGESAFAQYDRFTIAEPRTRYKIYVGAYSGTAGDSMTYHQGRPFSTFDNDNDIAVTNCALSYKGAFWYKNCHRVNLMGKYGDSSHSKGINWFHWKGHEHSIQFAEMKMRPADFRKLENRKKRS